VDIEDAVVVELGGDVEREGMRVRVMTLHVVGERGEADANTVATDLLYDGIDHLESKATPILKAATVLVSAIVDAVLKELLDDVAIGAMNLHTIETCHAIDVIVSRLEK
jgi:hypothetical protein